MASAAVELSVVDVAPQTTLKPETEVEPQTTLVLPHTTDVLEIVLAPQTIESPQTTDVPPQTTLVPPKAEDDVFAIVTMPLP